MRYLMVTTYSVFAMGILGTCGVERVAIDPVGYNTVSQGEEIIAGMTTENEIYLLFGESSSVLDSYRSLF